MVVLKLDPWRADFNAGAEVSFDDDVTRPLTDPFVESEDWSRPLRPDSSPPEAAIFVDGVMRTELRVMAADGDTRAWGMLGSCAAGAVLCDGAATFIAEDRPVRRVLALGGRIEMPDLELRVGAQILNYETHPVAQDSPQSLRIKLQRVMLDEEAKLAAELADRALVFADGPLHLDGRTDAPVVGVVKRMVKSYLEDEQAALLGILEPGERTPLFGLGNNVVDRYAWYVRLVEQDASWHELAGLVRCEVRMALGLARARAIADRVAVHLPAFAGRPGVDPRAPQNLTPVGALEARLKHRLGSSLVIGRALKAHLTKALDV